MKFRVGFGYDMHQLQSGRELWLGGIKIDHDKGLLGHSDADVIIHAICDALLGAANLRDIGYHFPNTATEYSYKVGNIDVTVCAEKPKINPHIPSMQKVLCEVMQIDEDDLSIKATTSEKMGFVGREEGITAYAVALIVKF